MLVKKDILVRLNGFDEQFFMYAEDIDLSYRILKLGYHNYYFADTCIIHFKGESTRKDAKYVKLFYKAMQQFVRKHYRSGLQRISSGLLNAAISMRAAFAKAQQKETSATRITLPEASLEGDLAAVARLQPLLMKSLTKPTEGSNTIILCEGKTYPFSQLIARLQQLQPGQRALVHAHDSYSIVGSFDKNEQGTIMAIV